jgi:hypothetical protein
LYLCLQVHAACASLAPRLSSAKVGIRATASSAISIRIVSHLAAKLERRILQERVTQKGAGVSALMRFEHALLIPRIAAALAASVLMAAVYADGVADGAFGADDGLRRRAGAKHPQSHGHGRHR